MSQLRSEHEIEQLIALARTYCEVRARHEYAQAEGRVTPEEDAQTRDYLRTLDEKIERLKSNNELVRSAAHARNNIIQIRNFVRAPQRANATGR
jgi:hypothetical protein